MFFTNDEKYIYWKVDGMRTVRMKCPNCSNTTDHFVMGANTGFHLGFIFQSARTRLGIKKYFLTCPICRNMTKELTKSELEYLKKE